MKKNILVFPCGSEIGLEIQRALNNSTHFTLYGASSIDNHGKFVFKNYISGIPFVNDENFIEEINVIIEKYNIDFIFPAHDTVVLKFVKNQSILKCPVITSDAVTCEIANSKLKTYMALKDIVATPAIYSYDTIPSYPVFLKPEVGQGSRGCLAAYNINDVKNALIKNESLLILEYLPKNEYTIDCFTNYKGELLFAEGRQRCRILNGISVNSKPVNDEQFLVFAQKINKALSFNGAWFFQVKERENGDFVLIEIATRIAGTMGLFRGIGVNFAQLSIFNALHADVSICLNKYFIEIDRALFARYKLNLDFDIAYIDLDDTILIDGKVNTDMIKFIYHMKNNNKSLKLISKHAVDIQNTLRMFYINEKIFDAIINIDKNDEKYKYISENNAIFIDDSFSERKKVFDMCNIPVFSVDMIETLIYGITDA